MHQIILNYIILIIKLRTQVSFFQSVRLECTNLNVHLYVACTQLYALEKADPHIESQDIKENNDTNKFSIIWFIDINSQLCKSKNSFSRYFTEYAIPVHVILDFSYHDRGNCVSFLKSYVLVWIYTL